MTVLIVIGQENGAMTLTRYDNREKTHGCAVLPGYEDDIQELIHGMRFAPSAFFRFGGPEPRPAA